MAVVVIRHGHGIARRLTSRYYGYLVYRVAVLHLEGNYGVTRLVVRGYLLVLLGNDAAAFFGADDGSGDSLLELCHGYLLFLEAGGEYCRLVEHVFKVGAGHSAGAFCKHGEVNVAAQRLALCVYLQNGLPALYVGITDGYLPIEPAGAQQRRVEYVRPVGRGDDDYALVHGKAVHFNEQLVQRLLPLVVTAAQAGAALTADRVYLIYKHNCGRALLCGIEQIAHAARADANEHFNKVRAGYREERNAGLPRNGLCKQRFAGARRADKQAALGYARAHLGEPLRRAHKLDDLAQLLLFLLRTRNVCKGDLFSVGGGPCAALAKVHYVASAALRPVHEHIYQHQAAAEHYVRHKLLNERRPRRWVEHQRKCIIRLRYFVGILAGQLRRDLFHVVAEYIDRGYVGVKVRLIRENIPAYLAVLVEADELQAGDLRSLYLPCPYVIYKFRIAYLAALRPEGIKAGYQHHDDHQHYKIYYRRCKVSSLQIFTSPVCHAESYR